MRAEAPSQEAKNKVWDQIKLVDATYQDLIADITVNEQTAAAPTAQTAAPKTQTAGASASGGQSSRTYTVKPGDSLSKISREFYGDANQYEKIFEANREKLSDPNKVRAGQELVIPE
jgi:nucleoid-associated protein YgaU